MMPFLERDGCAIAGGPQPSRVVTLLKERVSTVEELADAAVYFYRPLEPSMAVSYTHLRAHETVLDLVCRLLLEKKTTQSLTQLC